jgi:tetratricopeptide (TPR) repeat protein
MISLKMKNILILLIAFSSASGIYSQQNSDNLLKARALREAGKNIQSVSLLDEAINYSANADLYLERGEAKLAGGDLTGAISDFNEANNLTSQSGEYGLARAYAIKNDISTALYHLGLNMNSPFKRQEKEIMLEKAFTKLDNRPEWRQFWKKEWYSTSEKNIAEIEYLVNAGKLDESREVLSELRKNDASSDDFVYAEALINQSSGKNQEAISKISGIADPGEKLIRVLAKAQMAENNAAGASESYSKLLNSGVADAGLLLKRAECYRKTGESDKAMADVKRFLDIYPDNGEALSMAGKIEVRSGDNLQALDYFSRNLKLHPNDPQVYVDRGNSYFNARSWDMAINDYSMSLDLMPDNSDVWLNRGIALLNQGRKEDACHDFKKSYSLGNKRVADYLNRNCLK